MRAYSKTLVSGIVFVSHKQVGNDWFFYLDTTLKSTCFYVIEWYMGHSYRMSANFCQFSAPLAPPVHTCPPFD